MIRDVGTLVLIICGVLAISADRPGYAQTAAPSFRCNSWVPFATDPHGAKRIIVPVQVNRFDTGRYVPGWHLGRAGEFYIAPEQWVGVVRESASITIGKPYRFTVPVGSKVTFFYHSESGDRSGASAETQGGELQFSLPTGAFWDWPKQLGCETIRAGTVAIMQDVGAGPKGLPEFLATGEPKGESGPSLTERFSEGAVGTPPAGSRIGTPGPTTATRDPPPRPPESVPEGRSIEKLLGGAKPPAEPRGGLLKDVFPNASGTSSVPPKLGGERLGAIEPSSSANVKPVESAPLPQVDREVKAPPVRAPKLADGPVCNATTLKPLPVPSGVTLTSPQTVGVRNDKGQVAGFEYLDVGGDAFPLPSGIDVAASADRLVPYEAVATGRRGETPALWVSINGSDGARIKRNVAAPAKPTRLLRMLVVGGAAELAISGLDAVGAELEKQSGGQVKLDVEWHVVDETGSIKAGERYSSLDKLVKAAASKAAGRRPDVLNEAQLSKLFDDFENLMTSQAQVINKVFWIKGAYQIPSSIPRRFEKFLDAVSSSKAVVRAPSGRTEKWLAIVTARMPGFSVAYLKEPVYSLQIGDVIEEEAGASGARRLIGETGLWATRLGLSATAAPPGGADEPADPGALAGKLVIDAKDAFVERGYVLSAEAAEALQDHLKAVLGLWSGPAVAAEGLKQFADKSGKPSPTIIDLLQGVDDKAYPRLPRVLPDWARKPVKDLSRAESEAAKAFVAKYAEGAEKISFSLASLRKAIDSDAPVCGLFFASEELFGFKS